MIYNIIITAIIYFFLFRIIYNNSIFLLIFFLMYNKRKYMKSLYQDDVVFMKLNFIQLNNVKKYKF